MKYSKLQEHLQSQPQTWLVTGAAGFIGSNLLETLLRLGQQVVGLDNFSTGHRYNLEEVRDSVGAEAWARFRFVEGDVADEAACQTACEGVHRVLHQAALGSVPRSLKEPLSTHRSNVTGFLTLLETARRQGVKQFVYASSSSVYGDHPELPKREENVGSVLSPYAASKYADELYSQAYAASLEFPAIGLRYFNVFGKRQDPAGAYAAVIPKWADLLLRGETCEIYGDGETSRDFTHVDNVVQANLLSAMAERPEARGQAYNVACGEQRTLNELFEMLREILGEHSPAAKSAQVAHQEFRAGDIRHSLADIGKAQRLLDYQPQVSVREGLRQAMLWYRQRREAA